MTTFAACSRLFAQARSQGFGAGDMSVARRLARGERGTAARPAFRERLITPDELAEMLAEDALDPATAPDFKAAA